MDVITVHIGHLNYTFNKCFKKACFEEYFKIC